MGVLGLLPHQGGEVRKDTKGFTIQIAFGSWSKPTIQFGDFVRLRVCLGFCAVSFIAADMENFMVNVLKKGNTNGR